MATRWKAPPRTGERRKTFTGCWTCRSRRLRCDETRPACKQCTSKKLECGGYTTRLQWLPPKTGADPGKETCTLLVRTRSSQRRPILASIPDSVLGDAALDRVLEALDAENPLSTDDTRINGPFSVFSADAHDSPLSSPGVQGIQEAPEEPEPTEATKDDDAQDGLPAAVLPGPEELPDEEMGWSSFLDTELGSLNLDINPEPQAGFEVDAAPDVLDNSWDRMELDFPWLSDQSPISSDFPFPFAGDLLAEADQYENEASGDLVSSSMDILTGATPEAAFYVPDPTVAIYPARSSFVSDDSRFLLHHYVSTVVHIFSVVENHKSPWRTLHVPRALQGIGELEATGCTSKARNSLLHAILSVSAYSLVSKYKIQGQAESAEKWLQKALQYRFQAVNFLRSCLEEDLPSSSRGPSQDKPKYKELLAAMLTMVTIDIVSGDNRTCSIHLKGCESLIRFARRGWKRKYSTKACALHRTFYYLRVIHASTARSAELVTPIAKQAPSAAATTSPTGSHRDRDHDHDLDLDDTDSADDRLSSDLEEAESWLQMEETPLPRIDDLAACEFVYGIPQDLLVLMGKTTEVVQQVHALRREHRRLGPSLVDTCEALETDVLDWPVDAVLSSLARAPVGPDTRAIIEHQTRAVHKALVIYFSRHIRQMHRRYLQPYVESVISHMEAAEKIKEDSGLVAGPMVWQCFIAASEALDEDLQQRFLTWFDKTRSYGIEAGFRGREVVVEVWKKHRSGGSDVTADWRKVAEEKAAYLMLA